MSDPLSLAVLGAVGLTEGIKFLYGQAGEVLARWRDRGAGRAQGEEPMAIESPLLEGQLAPARVNHETIERLEGELTGLAGRLGNYANGLQTVDPGDVEMLEAADALRRALEVIYGQRITFRGEDRPPSGPLVIGRAEVDRVIGDVAGVRARVVRGHVEGELKAREVTGRASGVDADTIG
jgi:hypothetical protein